MLFEAKDELLERYVLAKGGPEELTGDLAARLIGLEKNEYGFTGLFDADSGSILPAGLVAEKPTVDQIVVHMLEEMK